MPISRDEYLHTVERMEPEITPVDLPAAAASIAISLKRIADALENQNHILGNLDVRLSCIEMNIRPR